MSFFIPTENGAGITFGFNDRDRDGRFDLDIGLTGYQHTGNGLYGQHSSGTIGFNTSGTAFVEGTSGSYTPWSSQQSHWGADSWQSYGGNSYGDVFGNYSNNRYASDIFGNWGSSGNHGNVWSGGVHHSSGGNVWAGVGGSQVGFHGPSVGCHGHRHFCGCGGPQINAWFGGCFG